MEDIDILKHAQTYIEKMANGVNPLTDEEIGPDDLLNQVRISRCLFYVNQKLKELIAAGGTVRASRPQRDAFVYDQGLIDKVEYEEVPISLSQIVAHVCAAYDDRCRLTYAMVSKLLCDEGILMPNPTGGSPKVVATPQAAQYGIWTEDYVDRRGEQRTHTLYDNRGQRFVVALLAKLA